MRAAYQVEGNEWAIFLLILGQVQFHGLGGWHLVADTFPHFRPNSNVPCTLYTKSGPVPRQGGPSFADMGLQRSCRFALVLSSPTWIVSTKCSSTSPVPNPPTSETIGPLNRSSPLSPQAPKRSILSATGFMRKESTRRESWYCPKSGFKETRRWRRQNAFCRPSTTFIRTYGGRDTSVSFLLIGLKLSRKANASCLLKLATRIIFQSTFRPMWSLWPLLSISAPSSINAMTPRSLRTARMSGILKLACTQKRLERRRPPLRCPRLSPSSKTATKWSPRFVWGRFMVFSISLYQRQRTLWQWVCWLLKK